MSEVASQRTLTVIYRERRGFKSPLVSTTVPTESKLVPAGTQLFILVFVPVPDCHPGGVRQSNQEDQNCHPGAKRSGDRHRERQGERLFKYLYHPCGFYKTQSLFKTPEALLKNCKPVSCCSTCSCLSCPETTPTRS